MFCRMKLQQSASEIVKLKNFSPTAGVCIIRTCLQEIQYYSNSKTIHKSLTIFYRKILHHLNQLACMECIALLGCNILISFLSFYVCSSKISYKEMTTLMAALPNNRNSNFLYTSE